MIITGKIEKILPVENGTSRSGKEWKKGGFVMDVTSDPNWPKKLMVIMFGKALDNIQIAEGNVYDVDCDVTSREWTNPNTGRTQWFTECSAFRATLVAEAATRQAPDVIQPQAGAQPPQTAFEQASMMYGVNGSQQAQAQRLFDNPNPDDDLPF